MASVGYKLLGSFYSCYQYGIIFLYFLFSSKVLAENEQFSYFLFTISFPPSVYLTWQGRKVASEFCGAAYTVACPTGKSQTEISGLEHVRTWKQKAPNKVWAIFGVGEQFLSFISERYAVICRNDTRTFAFAMFSITVKLHKQYTSFELMPSLTWFCPLAGRCASPCSTLDSRTHVMPVEGGLHFMPRLSHREYEREF